MKSFSLLVPACCLSLVSFAQLPYTVPQQYGWTVETDLVYGTAINYMGALDTLKLDLYKPVGDHNPQRPLLVLAHGGTWLAGCKDGLAWLAQEMAGRGYAVASVNYRLGWHKSAYVPAPNCLLDGTQRNLSPADSCEIIRALYRAQQDVKGAIRWLKERHDQDSTDVCRVLVGGESAGAFNALAVGFLDRCSEKPACCFDLPDAPAPDPNLLNQTTFDCVLQNWTVPPGLLDRPDLGSVSGELNRHGQDARVIGVLSLYGGVLEEAAAHNWLQGPDTPAVYLYHQTCDGIVPFGYGQPTFTISYFCNTGCTPWHVQYPHTYGSGSLAAAFATMPNSVNYSPDFDDCPAFNSDLALFECLRYADNGSYHFVSNPPLRAQRAADFFAPVLAAPAACISDTADCTVAVQAPDRRSGMRPAPNPFGDQLNLFCEQPPAEPVWLELFDATGRLVWRARRSLQSGSNDLLNARDLPAGMYALRARLGQQTLSWVLLHR